MTQKEALDQHVHPDLTDRWGQPVLDAVLAAITTYHEHQVKTFDLADVVGQSEQLLAFLKWKHPNTFEQIKEYHKKDIKEYLESK
jgi:hypothetical protein